MKKTLLLATTILVLFFSSCSSDDDNNSTPSSISILDKWWYDSNNYAANIYFNSNGEYQQVVNLLGTNIPGSGSWTWIEQNSILKIENLTGLGQTIPTVWLKFTDVEEHSMTVQQSTDGTNYSVEVYYLDTDN